MIGAGIVQREPEDGVHVEGQYFVVELVDVEDAVTGGKRAQTKVTVERKPITTTDEAKRARRELETAIAALCAAYAECTGCYPTVTRGDSVDADVEVKL